MELKEKDKLKIKEWIREDEEEIKTGCSRDKDRYLTGRIGAFKQVLRE